MLKIMFERTSCTRMNCSKLFNFTHLLHLSCFMPSIEGPNGVTEITIPNPCRHPAYHILPNTLLVYQLIYIKTSGTSILLYFMHIQGEWGDSMIIKILEVLGPFILLF